MRHILEKLIKNSILDEDKPRLYSRVHRLKGFEAEVYVKREDELSFGVSGSKLRKLLGIKKVIIDKGVKKLIVIGGLNSNHMLSSLQMALELGLEFELLCLKEHQTRYQGNRFLSELLMGSNHKINIASREDWPSIYTDTKEKYRVDSSVFVIAEGACQKDALYSAMTIFDEIELWHNTFKDSKELHVWVDSGSGLLAQALEIANCTFKAKFIIHPVLIAGDEAEYLMGLEKWLSCIKGDGLDLQVKPSVLHKPLSAKSFGATNRTVFTEIIKQARINGMLIDPIYAAKTLHLMNEEVKNYGGRHLWLHGGGAFSLFGYQEKILSYLS